MCKTYIAHNSIKDTIVLPTNLKTVNVAKTKLFFFIQLSNIVNSCHTKKQIWLHCITLQLVDRMSEKIAKSCLFYQYLQLTYERNGEDRIQALFREKFNES